MSEEKREALSALIDGELTEDAGPPLLDQVLSDVSLKRCWIAYHLIGDVMRKQSIDHGGLQSVAESPAAAVTSLEGSSRPTRRRAGGLAGLALAASVAAVAVIGIYAVSTPQSGSGPVEVVQSTVPAEMVARAGTQRVSSAGPDDPATVVAGGAAGIDLTKTDWNDSAPSVTNRLNGYLVSHNEHLADGMRGMLPYARLVAFDQESR